jgi:hypothetical protein
VEGEQDGADRCGPEVETEAPRELAQEERAERVKKNVGEMKAQGAEAPKGIVERIGSFRHRDVEPPGGGEPGSDCFPGEASDAGIVDHETGIVPVGEAREERRRVDRERGHEDEREGESGSGGGRSGGCRVRAAHSSRLYTSSPAERRARRRHGSGRCPPRGPPIDPDAREKGALGVTRTRDLLFRKPNRRMRQVFELLWLFGFGG